LGLNRAERRRREREERKKEKASGAASPVGHAVELTGEIIDHKCHAPVTLSDPFAKGPQAGLTIEALIDTGDETAALAELKKFKRRYPAYPLPPVLEALRKKDK